MTIGFIGQGFIGKNYADDFERRGFSVVRYALEEPYRANRERIAACDIVFIAVPTPTTPAGFDPSIVFEAAGLVGKGKAAVIKSTVLPGTTEEVQERYPDIVVLHAPEFLTEASAARDAANPDRTIIGLARESAAHRAAAEAVLAALPPAPFTLICSAREAELIKYGRNCLLYNQVVFINLLYNAAQALGCEWKRLQDTFAADPWLGKRHLSPVDKKGRGAGGHCFIKDMAAFARMYERIADDPTGSRLLAAIQEKNIELLRASGKDLDLLAGVYGQSRAAPDAAESQGAQ